MWAGLKHKQQESSSINNTMRSINGASNKELYTKFKKLGSIPARTVQKRKMKLPYIQALIIYSLFIYSFEKMSELLHNDTEKCTNCK